MIEVFETTKIVYLCLAQKQINLASLCTIDWNLIKSNFRQIYIDIAAIFLVFIIADICIWYDSLIF